MSKRIWSRHPANTGAGWDKEGWNEAYPIGNGSMGAMVYGDPLHDTLQLNEETIWYGNGGRNRVNPKAKDAYPEVRKLLTEGKIKAAQDIVRRDMFPVEEHERWYVTAENVWLDFAHNEYSDYTRELDIENAICGISYNADGHRYERELFVSAPDHVLVLRHASLDGGLTSCRIDFSRRTEKTFRYEQTKDGVSLYSKEPEDGCTYCISAACECVGGSVSLTDRVIEICDAREFTLYITIRTDFYGDDIAAWCKNTLTAARERGYNELRERHAAEYKSYFDRVRLTIDGENMDDIPTEERLSDPDNKLAELYFDFGRYLLISCSRPGTKPANLQGIWNKDQRPSWGSKFTININTEMNYWPAEVTALSDCHMPLFEHLKTMLPYGKKVAADMYGLEGFTAHHNTDIFGDCAPQDYYMPATIWPMGAAWLSTHIWTHYDYTRDTDFLREYLPIMKEACRFFTGYMFEYNGKLLTGPSVSPENTYIHASGERGQMCIGPTMDSMIIRDLFTSCIEASRLLGEEDELTEKLGEMLGKIPQPSIGKHGQLMEWAEDYDEAEPGHRHISHLYGLYPSSQLSYEETPDMMEAARVTLERRLSHGGGHTGWSRAWIINMWARLRDGDKAGENVRALLSVSTYPSFLDKHPPFQIDGNFGGTAGIAEMLLQSHNGTIILLPALPSEWASGSVYGLRARGNVTVDIEWKHGQVVYAKLTANSGGKIRLIVPSGFGDREIFESERDNTYSVVLKEGRIEVPDR